MNNDAISTMFVLKKVITICTIIQRMCSLLTDDLHLLEHEDARWLPADVQLLPFIAQELA